MVYRFDSPETAASFHRVLSLRDYAPIRPHDAPCEVRAPFDDDSERDLFLLWEAFSAGLYAGRKEGR